MPSAFAAIVRKLMSKKPEERYQNCAELKSDLARWTDPDRVRAILGAEAEAARSFRPPPPILDEEDLRLLDVEDPGSRDDTSLRRLGGAEPSTAPRHQPPPAPVKAVFRAPNPRDSRSSAFPSSRSNDNTWLLHFALIAVGVGLVAIVVISLWYRS